MPANAACPVLLVALLLASAPEEATPPKTELLLRDSYPLEVSVSFPAGLFHWIDSLAGTSHGKTVQAYQQEFEDRFGRPTRQDMKVLSGFIRARARHAVAAKTRAPGDPRVPPIAALLERFCEAATVEAALDALRDELDPADWSALRLSLDHFRPRYETIWNEGRVASQFLRRCRKDPAKDSLADLLERIAGFFGADPLEPPRPRIVLVPVPPGFGTHAEAVGRNLLIEIRPGEGLADEASVIVHENAHFMFARVSAERTRGFASLVLERGPVGLTAWETLREALPTALGQGVADSHFRPSAWSERGPWYHTADVDAYAKAIYPIVRASLERGGRLDASLVLRLLDSFPGRGDGRPSLIRRSP